MHLVIKMPQNGGHKGFRLEQTPKKVPLLFLYVKMLEDNFLDAVNKQARYGTFI